MSGPNIFGAPVSDVGYSSSRFLASACFTADELVISSENAGFITIEDHVFTVFLNIGQTSMYFL